MAFDVNIKIYGKHHILKNGLKNGFSTLIMYEYLISCILLFALIIFPLLPEQNRPNFGLWLTRTSQQHGPYRKPNYMVNMFNMQVNDVKR